MSYSNLSLGTEEDSHIIRAGPGLDSEQVSMMSGGQIIVVEGEATVTKASCDGGGGSGSGSETQPTTKRASKGSSLWGKVRSAQADGRLKDTATGPFQRNKIHHFDNVQEQYLVWKVKT